MQIGSKRVFNGDIRAYWARFMANQSRSRLILNAKFVAISAQNTILINANLRELCRFTCAFAALIGERITVFNRKTARNALKKGAISTGTL